MLLETGGVHLRSVVNHAWDHGIAVLPLQDRINIHGAFWNFGDRAAIVIKQGMCTTSRWLIDLLHELYHAATEPDGIVDAESTNNENVEELANEYAADVVLDGRSEQREFVWRPEKVCSLCDSVMQGYPFGEFMFWTVEAQNAGKYRWYDFVCEYHQRDSPHCPDLGPIHIAIDGFFLALTSHRARGVSGGGDCEFLKNRLAVNQT